MNNIRKKILAAFLAAVMICSIPLAASNAFVLTDENESSTERVSHSDRTDEEESSQAETKKTYKDFDFTGDGKFSLMDIRYILRMTAKLEIQPEWFDYTLYDMNKDGKVTASDARLLLIDFVGIDTSKSNLKPATTVPPTTKPPETTTKRDNMKPVDSGHVLGSEGGAFRESVVYDLTNDQMLYAYNSTAKAYPASMTKLMTALVASMYVPMDYVITVGSEIYMTESNSSLSGIRPGYRMTMKDLITSLLLPSGCDSAYCIAVQTARYVTGMNMGQENALRYFVNLMNETAQKLGCVNTHFVNPSGFPYSNHYTCARDMALIAKEIYWNRTLRLIASWYRKTITIESGQTLTYDNSNKLLWQGSGYYYSYAMGMKTGTTSEAGCCLTATAEKDGRALLVVIMGAPYNYGRYQSAIDYFNYYFNRG